jgi:hypothetical protein
VGVRLVLDNCSVIWLEQVCYKIVSYRREKVIRCTLVYRYIPEGNMTACGTDYLSKEWFSRSYLLIYSIFVYFVPLFTIIYSYFFIVQAVAAHEKGMREQAKKMNVASLRSAENQATSAECKLAKVKNIGIFGVMIYMFFFNGYYYDKITFVIVIKGGSNDHFSMVHGMDAVPSNQLPRYI